MWGKRLLLAIGILVLPGAGGWLIARELPFFRLDEEKAGEFLEKGVYHFNASNYVAAREYFYRSLDAKPDFPLARKYLGDSYYFAGDYESALEQWEALREAGGADAMLEDRLNLVQHRFTDVYHPGPYAFYGWIQPERDRFVPVDVQVDENENVFVLSYDPPGIYRFRPSFVRVPASDSAHGGREGSFEKVGARMGGGVLDRLKGPVAFTLKDDLFYVADYRGDRVHVIDPSGHLVRSFGASGAGDGQFHGPSGIAVSGKHIIVSDGGNRRLQRFDMEGNFVDAWKPEGLIRPAGLAAMGRQLAVADSAGAVLLLDEDGLVQQRISDPALKKPSGLDWRDGRLLIADEKTGAWIRDGSGALQRLEGLRDEQDHSLPVDSALAFRADTKDRLYIAGKGGAVIHATRETQLRSSLDVTFYRAETESYPNMAAIVRVMDRSPDGGSVVTGLKEENFHVYENGSRLHPIRVDGMEPFQNRMNLVLVKENSRALSEGDLSDFLDRGLMDVLAGIRLSDRIRAGLADSRLIDVYEGQERRLLLKRLRSEPPTAEPAIGRALYDGVTALLDRKGPAGVLFVTSGRSFAGAFDRYDPTLIIQYARAHAIPIHILSFEADAAGERQGGVDGPDGADRSTGEIYKRICRETGGHYVRFFDETERKALYGKMRSVKDPRYIITYRSPGGEELRGHYMDIKVEIQHRKTSGAADGGYFVP